MISEELKAIIDKLNEQGKMAFLEAATEEEISQFEENHKVKLPEKYKEWLQHSDGGRHHVCVRSDGRSEIRAVRGGHDRQVVAETDWLRARQRQDVHAADTPDEPCAIQYI